MTRSRTLSSEKKQFEYSINTKENNSSLKRSYKLNKEFSTDGVTLSVKARP